MGFDAIKVLNELVNSNYFSQLKNKEKKEKWDILVGWLETGLDAEVLEHYSKTRIVKLTNQPNIKNMLELSLYLKKLFHYEELKNNPQLFSTGKVYYDSIYDNFNLDSELNKN